MNRFLWFLVFSAAPIRAAELLLVPSPEMPVTTINGVTAVDLRHIAPNDLISFELYLTDVDFSFAGCEFRVYYPIFLGAFETLDAPWALESQAVFTHGPDFGYGRALVLPVNESGVRIAPRNVASGTYMVGMVFLDALSRWKGTPQDPHPGGLLGTFRMRYNPNQQTHCTSRLESFQVGVSPVFNNGEFDFFSDDTGGRVQLVAEAPLNVHGLPGLPVYVGNPDVRLRADANDDGVRDALDALAAANCALNGPDSPNCVNGYWNQYPAEFLQVFDFNCDGTVNSLDALGLSRMALRLRLGSNDLLAPPQPLVEAPGGQTAVMVLHTYLRDGKSQPKLKAEDKRTWDLVWEATGTQLELMMIHKDSTTNAPVPTLKWTGKQTVEPVLVQATTIDAGQRVRRFGSR